MQIMTPACARKQNPCLQLVICGLFLSAATGLSAQSAAHGHLRTGDRLYDQKNYPKAENAYGKAPADPVALYNAGNAAYQ
ncbi:MAG: hypothetical protein IPH12_21000 [Saprospirales bacterium]|nr:hypothetical protein [Saprospirales bacterium]